MAKPTLAGLYTLTQFNSSNNTVETEQISHLANLFYVHAPGTDPRQKVTVLGVELGLSENISILPKQRIISLTGKFQGNETTIKSFVIQMENITLDNQTELQYTSSYGQTYSCKINSFITFSKSEPSHINYSMELFIEAGNA